MKTNYIADKDESDKEDSAPTTEDEDKQPQIVICKLRINFHDGTKFALLEKTSEAAVEYCNSRATSPSTFATAAHGFISAVLTLLDVTSASAEVSLSNELPRDFDHEIQRCHDARGTRDYWTAIKVSWNVRRGPYLGTPCVRVEATLRPRWVEPIKLCFNTARGRKKFAALCQSKEASCNIQGVKDELQKASQTLKRVPSVPKAPKDPPKKSNAPKPATKVTKSSRATKNAAPSGSKGFGKRPVTNKWARKLSSSPEPILATPLPPRNKDPVSAHSYNSARRANSDSSDDDKPLAELRRLRMPLKPAPKRKSKHSTDSSDDEPQVRRREIIRATPMNGRPMPTITKSTSLVTRQDSPTPSASSCCPSTDEDIPLAQLRRRARNATAGKMVNEVSSKSIRKGSSKLDRMPRDELDMDECTTTQDGKGGQWTRFMSLGAWMAVGLSTGAVAVARGVGGW
ncbi:MAG: hypothetical protein Q9162_007003 [Coniocarpon cinnabarinum]